MHQVKQNQEEKIFLITKYIFRFIKMIFKLLFWKLFSFLKSSLFSSVFLQLFILYECKMNKSYVKWTLQHRRKVASNGSTPVLDHAIYFTYFMNVNGEKPCECCAATRFKLYISTARCDLSDLSTVYDAIWKVIVTWLVEHDARRMH